MKQSLHDILALLPILMEVLSSEAIATNAETTVVWGKEGARYRRRCVPVIRLRTHNLCVSEGSLSQGSLQPMLQQHMGDLPAVVEQFSGALPLRRDSSLLHPGKSRSKTPRASE